jgi:DnaJ-class molecular chaperone
VFRQVAMADSLYDVLGVAKTATEDEIRKAYRKLARTHHPDVNPGDKRAEEQFKKVAGAYDVIGDPAKRKAYDEFGDASTSTGFDPAKAREYARWQDTRQQRTARGFEDDVGPQEFDFSEMFGRGRTRGPRPGPDLHSTVQMDLRQAIEGGEVTFDIPNRGPTRVRIPPGADTNSTVRIAGKGAPGVAGGPAGDLLIQIEVEPHPLVQRDGLDLRMSLPVTLDEAYNGGSVEVPTFKGTVALKIPARSQNGAVLRLRGKGVTRKDQHGDLYVVLDVRLPDREDPELSAAVRGAVYSKPVREEVTL